MRTDDSGAPDSALLVISPGVQALALEPLPYLRRHQRGDRDSLPLPALISAEPTSARMSAYATPRGELWFVTDEDAWLTVCLRPVEYATYFGAR